MEPEALMRLAIEKCRQGIAAGQSPFGCAIARGDDLLACEHNTVAATCDATAHAEVNALRAAGRREGSSRLPGVTVAATCEPCPMCMAALHFAGVEKVYFGASVEDAKAAGFKELQLPAKDLVAAGGNTVKLMPRLLPEESANLFAEWKQARQAKS
ncbi:MAG: nucleoside deaminase [Planctomycetota bacterium]